MFVFQLTETLSLLEHEKRLRDELKDLTDTRNARLEELKTLNDEQLKLCHILSEQPHHVDITAVPSVRLLQQIKEHILSLECEKVRHADR